jgi:hypothetical protein
MDAAHRTTAGSSCHCLACQQHPFGHAAVQQRLLNRLVASADERTRRLLVGFLALEYGRGGITRLARITGLSRPTIRRGLRELRQPPGLPPGRVRRPGGGAPRVEATRPKSSGPWRSCSGTPRLVTRPAG